MRHLELVHADPTANPPLTDEEIYFAATALTCIQGGAQGTPQRGNSATRLMRVKNFLLAAMIRGDVTVDVDEMIRIAEGDVIPDLVA
jgi:hypothetical protein